MQRDEVFYLHSNLLFQQFSHGYIDFLGLVRNGLRRHGHALQSSLNPSKTGDPGHKVMKGKNDNTNKQETKRGDLGPSTALGLPSSSVWIQKSQSKCWMNPFSGSSFTQQTWLIIASGNIVFPLGDIRKWHKGERGCCSSLKEKAALGGNHTNT